MRLIKRFTSMLLVGLIFVSAQGNGVVHVVMASDHETTYQSNFAEFDIQVTSENIQYGKLNNTGRMGQASGVSPKNNGKGQNKRVVKVKTKKENKKNVNHGNSLEKSWNHKMIQTEVSRKSDKVIKVAIIDSGVNYSSDIDVAVRRNFIEDDECSVLYEDFSDHGTAIAGIICAQDNEEGITGINPCVELYSARVLDENLEAPIERVISAISWAIEENVDIINMSFGTEQDSPELHQIIKEAYENGILLISAAGNDGMIVYPAAYEEVVAVGAIDSLGNSIQDEISGSINEIMAPGENILSSAIFDGVIGGSGTSLAAAHVTGVASLLMEKYPDMPAEFIRILMDYSANLYGDKDIYGNGVIDYEYALRIAPSVKKSYEKYLRKTAQNEKQREKQMERFWSEIIKDIPENVKAVEVFEGVENVVGLWTGTAHGDLVQFADENTKVDFDAKQLSIIKAGCKYPDKSKSTMEYMNYNPYHGFYWLDLNKKTEAGGKRESNYLANYIFLTRLAVKEGKFADVKRVNGMSEYDYKRMEFDFQDDMVGGMTYENAFVLMKLRKDSEKAPIGDEDKSLFLYGIAMHLAGDVFAHSAWRYDESLSKAVGLTHEDSVSCDDVTRYPKRYEAAKQVMRNVLVKAQNTKEGTLQDFGVSAGYYGITSSSPYYDMSVEDSNHSTRYYLFNYQKYAMAVDPVLFSNWAKNNSSYYISFHCADLQSHFSEKQILDGKVDTEYDGVEKDAYQSQ